MTAEWAQVWATVAASVTQTVIGVGLIAITGQIEQTARKFHRFS